MSDAVAHATKNAVGQAAVSVRADDHEVDIVAPGDHEEPSGGRVRFSDGAAGLHTGAPERLGPAMFEIVLEITAPGPHRVGRKVADELSVVGQHVNDNHLAARRYRE